MKIVGMMPARNEDWCIGLSLRVALMWCDAVVVLDHASTDRTERVCEDIMSEATSGAVLYSKEPDPKWDEMRHRNWMLHLARDIGGTHMAIIDADEVLTGNLLERIRPLIEAAGDGRVVQLPGYNLRNSLGQYHSNGVWGNRLFSLAFQDDPALHWPLEETFHHREPKGLRRPPFKPVAQGDGGIMHLWGASYRRLVAKHALYKLTERIKDPSKDVAKIDFEYSQAIHGRGAFDNPRSWDYASVPTEWWKPYAGLWPVHLELDAEPWQEAECRRIVAAQPDLVNGLDLFGVV